MVSFKFNKDIYLSFFIFSIIAISDDTVLFGTNSNLILVNFKYILFSSGNEIGNILKPIVNILTAIGVIALIVITMIMGIKYMFATPEEAAKLKQQLIGLVVSAVVVLGATAIWKIIYNILVASKL